MSPRSTPSDLPFGRFALGQAVYAQDLQEVAENLNYAGSQNPEHLAGLGSGSAGWGGADSQETHGVVITGAASTAYGFRVWVDAGLAVVRFAARLDVPTGTTCTATITVGGDSQTITVIGASTPTDVETVDLDVGDTGTGLLDCTLVVERTDGAGAGELLAWSLFGLPIDDVDLPAPPDE